ncbi:MAG: hypothetical protein KKD63_14370, partial [Proteobacteria bacterium]|nr:hypothetical protein [Pseudomonadota bacterium]
PILPEVAEAYEWALEYLDGVADKLLWVRSDPDKPYHGIDPNAGYKPEWLEYALGMRETAEGLKKRGGGKQHFADKRDYINRKRYVDLVIALLAQHEGMPIDDACQEAVVILAGCFIFPVPKAKEEFHKSIKPHLAPINGYTEEDKRKETVAKEKAVRDLGTKYYETVRDWYKQWPQ